MDKKDINNLLFTQTADHNQEHADCYVDHYLEQYKTYLHIFNHTSDRRQKANEFFLGINAAIIGILGYIEIRMTFQSPIFFIFIPIVGTGICYSWYKIISSYKQLNRAKFAIIHMLEKRLPIALFETEWELLGKGMDKRKYDPLSQIEKNIPLMFISIYVVIIFTKLPWTEAIIFLNYLKN
ncbi:MAG: hypothetical protein V4665_00330 [Patescibacteria group bacterium]